MKSVLLAVLMVATMTAAQIPTNGLVARYDFTKGSLEDGSGNGRDLHLVLPEIPTCADRNGIADNAYLFTISSPGYFDTKDTGLPSGNSSRSVCFWICLTNPGGLEHIVSWSSKMFQEEDTTMSFRVGFKKDSLCIQQNGIIYAQTHPLYGQFPEPYNDSVWAHVAVTTTKDTIRWYVNGSLLKIRTMPELNTRVPAAHTRLIIGSTVSRFSPRGKIDDILIYNRVLTASEVQKIYKPTTNVSTNIYKYKSLSVVKTTQKNYTIDGRMLEAVYRTASLKTTSFIFVR